ncbi:hypothetical protein RBH29_17150, partial [Herbivorax sp. ANBcel31]|uniref:hypothetical protein n=1 Tax=Herbivorax sp. ANBcel31 TaxID=3069754 RepID=UPI0027B6F29F
VAPTYTVTFTVEDTGTDAIEGAEISIDGQTLTTDAEGETTIDLEDGTYAYQVTADGYVEETGSVEVDGSGVSETVTMTEIGLTGNVEDITIPNVLIVGQYAFNLDDDEGSYTLNNYLTAAGTVYRPNGDNEIYYSVGDGEGGVYWYNLVHIDEEDIELPQDGDDEFEEATVDASEVNGNGSYTHWNMTDIE